MPAVMDWAFVAEKRSSDALRTGFRSPAKAWEPSRTGSPLTALFGNRLAARFHGWRGASGKRYVCTVFCDPFEICDFAAALVLCVARDHDGSRRLVAMAATDDPVRPAWLDSLAQGRPVRGANEWHVHLIAATAADRAAALEDLRATLAPAGARGR